MADVNSFTLSVIDTATNTVVATIPFVLGEIPIQVAITPDGARSYVTSFTNPGTVSVIDTATNTVLESIPVSPKPEGVAITPDGTRAYVPGEGFIPFPGTLVSVVDTATNTVIGSIPVGRYPDGIAIASDGTRGYVTNGLDNTVTVIDITTNTAVATIPVGRFPEWVAIVPGPKAPKSKEGCKHGAYLKFGPPVGPFKNQGQCVRYVEHHH